MIVELILLPRVAFRGEEITGARPGALLALLAGELRAGVSTARLIGELWPEEQPEHPAKALQILVSRVRARLGPDVVVRTPTGYRLALAAEQVDAAAVRLYASASAQAGDQTVALAAAEAGLALCAGVASWEDTPGDALSALRAARLPAYRSLLRCRALALARLGRHAEAAEPLAGLVEEHPRDEELLAELLRGEAATVGAAAALGRYDTYRRQLREELGTDPGPALRELHRALLAGESPPVRRGVRAEPNALLGREKDVAAVAGLLRTSRVTSIVGIGGLGKTRLAHAVARGADQRVVHVVGLAGVGADDDVAAEVGSALGVRDAGLASASRLPTRPDALAGLADVLGPGPALLVLDNCEHVVRGAAELVQALVSASPELRVLTTSRAPLRLSSEAVYQLPELDLPTMAELFGRRARAIRPDVELPPAVVAELCGRLDGLPLAVELAAARVRVMSVAELARRLDDRFELLRAGPRDAPQRHRTLAAVIDWSWHLLEPAGQEAMRALSVFPGGFSAAAARHLLGSDAVLEQLADHSLLQVAEDRSGTRFRMLETVREFSTARRTDAGESGRVVDSFLAWARDFGARWQQSDLTAGLAAVAEVRAEQDNLLLALRLGLDRRDGATVAATAALLGGLWVTESNLTRLAGLQRDTAWELSHFRPGRDFVEATRTTAVLGTLAGFVMPDLSPMRSLSTLLRLPPAPPDTPVRAIHIALCAPDAEALAKLAEGDEPLLAAVAAYVLSYLWENQNDLPAAFRVARRMLAVLGEADRPLIRALAHARMGELCLQLDPGEPAYFHLAAALSFMTGLGWPITVRGRWALVMANLQRGAYDEAERGLAEATQGPGDDPVDPERIERCARAEIMLGRGDVEGGLRLWREAALDRTGGRPDAGFWPYEVEAVAVITHALHERVGLVRDIVDTLPGILAATAPVIRVPEFPVCGTLLLALAMADIDRGEAAPGARMIALAERFGVLRGYRPEISPELIRDVAERADRAAYTDGAAAYAGLDHGALREAVAAVIADRAGRARVPTRTRIERDRRTRR